MAAFPGTPNFFQPFIMDTVETVEEPFIEAPDFSDSNKDAHEVFEKRIMYDDFATCGVFPESPISAEDLVNKLAKSRRSYDEEMLHRIYASLASYQSCCGTLFVNGRQFVEAYMKRKRELSRMLDMSNREMEAAEKMLQQAEANLRKNNADNIYGEESKLTVQIVSVQNVKNIDEENTCMYKVHLECQQQVIETKVAYINQGIIFFNEMFSFEINRRDGDLRLRFVQVEPYAGNETVLGDCSVMVDDLSDQRKHEMTKEVWGTSGEILLSCQWIYSKKLLYESYMREFSAKRDQKMREMAEYQLEFDKLNRPFVLDNRGNESMWCGLCASGPEFVSKSIDQLMANLKITNMHVTAQYVVGISFFISFMASYSRAVFLDELVAAFAFWCNLDWRRWTVTRYNVLMCATFISLMLDCLWIKVYFPAWTLGSAESDIHNISKFFSIFLFLWKIVLVVFFWKARFDLKKKVSYNERLGVGNDSASLREERERKERMERVDRQQYANSNFDSQQQALFSHAPILSHSIPNNVHMYSSNYTLYNNNNIHSTLIQPPSHNPGGNLSKTMYH